MVVNDDACFFLQTNVAFSFFASKLAPTVIQSSTLTQLTG